ncbi:MAG TPA: tetratricopeptide repeat protein [Rhodanobacteraceae bacterium]|nr:tetratricopeptide repeat protein [Rhodanobacteraceae bacterium]
MDLFGPLHFLRPWWWLALLPLPLALVALTRGGGRGALARLADAALLPYLLHGHHGSRRTRLVMLALAWLLAVAALAGPAWQRVEVPVYQNGAARVIALSLSTDMLATDVPPDRMLRARLAVEDLLDGAGDARTALVAYAGAAFTVAPLTDDRRTVLNLLRDLSPDVMPVPGNDAAAGIGKSVQLLQGAGVREGQIVVVTDTAGAPAVAAARAARKAGYRVDVLGVGTVSGAPVPLATGGFAEQNGAVVLARRDDAALRAVAAAGGGSYAALPVAGATNTFAVPTARAVRADRGAASAVWRDGGVWLLPVLLVLAALAFRRGWLLVLLVCAMPMAIPPAQATTWSSLWSNRDQRAAQALSRGDAHAAQALATTPALRGAADYRGGDYASAAKAFAGGDDARAHYNLGNALAQQGRYPQAIAAWQQALRRDPRLADARANIAAVEAWLKRHPQPPAAGQAQSNHRPGQRGTSGSSPSSSGSQGKGQANAQSGNATSPPRAQGPSSDPADAASGSEAQSSTDSKGANGATVPHAQSDRGSTPGEAARQQRQAAQASQDLARELQARQPAGSALHAGGSGTFALGTEAPHGDDRLDAQQRALLRSVPDDPGALLRRKFRLEWEQRNGRQVQEDEP